MVPLPASDDPATAMIPAWWVNAPVPSLDWIARHSSRDYEAEVGHIVLDPERTEGRYQGGLFAAEGHFDDGV